MKTKTIVLYASLLFLFLLCSCSREFSKYQKTEKNDLERSNLLGKIKSVTCYSDDEISEVKKYNKYGFITEEIDYSEGEIEEKKTYTYNEFGKVSRIETTNSECHKADITIYDEYGYSTEEFTEIFEVFDPSSDLVVGKKLDFTYENNYDKLGGLLSRKYLSRDGSCFREEHYNQEGKVSKEILYSEDGTVDLYTEYIYKANVLAVEKVTRPNLQQKYFIAYYDQHGHIVKTEELNEDGSIYEVRDYYLDYKGFLIKEVDTYLVTPWYSKYNNFNVGDTCHTVTVFDNDEHGNTLKETITRYDPNENMSLPKEADEINKFQYKYDSHGNIIYAKYYKENREFRYEISYY